jgi:hypothetical protein
MSDESAHHPHSPSAGQARRWRESDEREVLVHPNTVIPANTGNQTFRSRSFESLDPHFRGDDYNKRERENERYASAFDLLKGQRSILPQKGKRPLFFEKKSGCSFLGLSLLWMLVIACCSQIEFLFR